MLANSKTFRFEFLRVISHQNNRPHMDSFGAHFAKKLLIFKAVTGGKRKDRLQVRET